jgi:pyruvate/2-oxoacid:ferredoxin oxidoreductase beta subunit/Pyruvate/2-oxoacid:ferredoxin oxidoreductase gamma subunit
MMPYPFCPGCGHATIVDQLDAALVELQLDRHRTVVVVDIGCVALTREFFDTNWFLGLHGRSITYATGMKLFNPDLHVIVLLGDGGLGIGGHHLVSAARRNVGLTVLLFNNMNFGMTGGQHSVTTPMDSITATTPDGHLERPLDACALASGSGASFVARVTSFDQDLSRVIAEAIGSQGFSLVDIWEPCTAYYVPHNRFGRKRMGSTLAALDFPTGILQRQHRPEYSTAYRDAVSHQLGQPLSRARMIVPSHESALTSRVNLLVAGDAGMRVQSASRLLCQGALLSGLWASQRGSYSVAVRSGHSVSEMALSPERILFPDVQRPDVVVVLSSEGMKKARSVLSAMTETDMLYINGELQPPDTGARKVVLDFERAGSWRSRREYWTLMALAQVTSREGLYPVEALVESVREQKEFSSQNLAALAASNEIVVSG